MKDAEWAGSAGADGGDEARHSVCGEYGGILRGPRGLFQHEFLADFIIVHIGSKPLKIQAIGELTALFSLIWCAPLPRGSEPIITGEAAPQYLLYYGNRKTENS